MKATTLFSAAAALALSASQANAAYVLSDVMWGSTFFNYFNFVTVDPNNGYVKYLTKAAAQTAGLIYAAEGAAVRISADSTTTLSGAAGTGRNSVRIESTKSWTHGLFVFNIAQMPAPSCGIWPALWMVGNDWPNNGEIDIIEGVNLQRNNLMSLHTSATCTVPGLTSTSMIGSWVGTNCDVAATSNSGCGVTGASADTYGNGFNGAGGGIIVMEWTAAFIKIWWYTKATIPADIKNGTPDQTKRGRPQGFWQGNQGCTLDNKIKNNRLVINTNFCGDWAGNAGVWSSTTACSSKASTCSAFVAKNPGDYANAKWLINSIKVYTQSTAKRGIEDPTLEFEAAARAANETITGEDSETVELRSAAGEQPLNKRHMHRHMHRNGGLS